MKEILVLPGGNIFGIGNNFINNERLNIYLHGGNGSDGQSGGKGK